MNNKESCWALRLRQNVLLVDILHKSLLLKTLQCGLGRQIESDGLPTHRSVPDAPDPAVEECASLKNRGHISRVSQFHL